MRQRAVRRASTFGANTIAALGLLVAACSKTAPVEGKPLLDRTKAQVDAVCACKADQECRKRELLKYQALVDEVSDQGPTNVGAEVVEALGKEAQRVVECTR